MIGRLIDPVLVTLAVLGAVSAGSSARAAVVLEFDPPMAAVGARVAGSTGDSLPIAGAVYLAPSQQVADKAADASHERLARFGRLRIKDGVGMFTGTVPRVAPGNYVAVADCRSCPGDVMITVGDFKVTGSPLVSTGRSITNPVVIAALLALAGSLVMFRPLSYAMGADRAERPEDSVDEQLGQHKDGGAHEREHRAG